ncbi:plant transposase, partial [Striga asiatica]
FTTSLLARNSVLAPLNFLDWRRVSNKDKLWEYVKKKFIISEEGKDYVLSSIGALWRTHKSRIKKRHYSKYDNDEERWENQPRSIPDEDFTELLNYWDLEEVKEQAEIKPPSIATMYMETRKEGMEKNTRHLMRTKNEKQPSNFVYHLFLMKFCSHINPKSSGEIIKVQISLKVLTSITLSVNDRRTFEGTNNKQLIKGEDIDDGANLQSIPPRFNYECSEGMEMRSEVDKSKYSGHYSPPTAAVCHRKEPPEIAACRVLSLEPCTSPAACNCEYQPVTARCRATRKVPATQRDTQYHRTSPAHRPCS